MLTANKRREDENPTCELEWQWTPGNSLPPEDNKRANEKSTTEGFRIRDVLFADDITLVTKKLNLETGRDIKVETLKRFEEI